MGRKNRSRKQEDPGKAADFVVNPFSSLKLNLPDPPHAPASGSPGSEATPKTGKADERSTLDRDDAVLLEAFTGKSGNLEVISGAVLIIGIQRKGRGGKTITWVRGLHNLDLEAQMAMSRDIRKSLGIGGEFHEGILELQGDQRERAGHWFEQQGYRIRNG